MHLRETLTKPAYDIPTLLSLVPIGRSSIYAHIANGLLRATKCGRRTLSLADDVLDWLEELRRSTPQADVTD